MATRKRTDQSLVERGLAPSRARAQAAIASRDDPAAEAPLNGMPAKWIATSVNGITKMACVGALLVMISGVLALALLAYATLAMVTHSNEVAERASRIVRLADGADLLREVRPDELPEKRGQPARRLPRRRR